MVVSHTVGALTTNYTWEINTGLPVVLQDGSVAVIDALPAAPYTNH